MTQHPHAFFKFIFQYIVIFFPLRLTGQSGEPQSLKTYWDEALSVPMGHCGGQWGRRGKMSRVGHKAGTHRGSGLRDDWLHS